MAVAAQPITVHTTKPMTLPPTSIATSSVTHTPTEGKSGVVSMTALSPFSRNVSLGSISSPSIMTSSPPPTSSTQVVSSATSTTLTSSPYLTAKPSAISECTETAATSTMTSSTPMTTKAGSNVKHVAVIGAGCSGLAAVKSCLEAGLRVTCYEREDDVGGLWNYQEDQRPGRGAVYRSCVINTSKEMTAFSDFPVPEDFPPFMPHAHVMRYIQMYVDNFHLRRHIRFSRSIESVSPADDYDVTGAWLVTSRCTEDEQAAAVTVERYDAVMVCSGHHVYPYVPQLPGIDDFRGERLHSHEYRRPEVFDGRRVLIIGIGNSAVDIAVDLSRTASQVYLSTRRGAWIVGRMGPLGYPADALANSRFMFTLPQSWLQWMVEVMADYRFDHDNYGLKPTHRALEAHPTINDDLPHRIMVGSVQLRPHVANFGSNYVVFEDGTQEEIDAVIFATGYDYVYKFLDKTILPIHENKVDLYKFVFPPHLKHPTLGLVGLVQAIGAVIPISEMQTRWFTAVIIGKAKLPDKETMLEDIRRKQHKMTQQYLLSRRHKLQTFWISYMDEVAELIGARPSILNMLFTEPCLALRCFFGPCIPAQYRLVGPSPWKGARNAIRKSLSNNVKAIRTRVVPDKGKPKPRWRHYIVVITAVVSLMFALFLITV